MADRHLDEILRETVAQHGARPAMFWKSDGSWRHLTYAQALQQVDGVAAGLIGLGIEHGDRVAIFSQNRPEWAIADFAALSIGAVTVPIYATNTADQVAYILNQSGSQLVFVGDEDQAATVAAIADRCPGLQQTVVLGDSGRPDAMTLARLSQESNVEDVGVEMAERRDSLDTDDVASIIYTSGTTGEPKGVMLSHANFAHQMEAVDAFFEVGSEDRSLCFLPLSHVYERSWSYYVFSRGARNYYLSNPRDVVDYLPEVKPTAMVSVPRLYEKVYAGVMAKVESSSGLRKRLFHWAIGVGGRHARAVAAGTDPGVGLRLSHLIADRLVLAKIRDVVGGPKNFFSAGGAPLSASIEEFFLAAGLLICQGYGLTETSPMVTCNSPGRYRFGTVGHPIPGCEIRIADDGEILVRGANVMQGYFDNPEATADALRDGWFHTGDIGHLDDDGFLVITDRLKDIIITSGGKNIAPQRIETAIGRDHFIEQIAVIGDRQKFVGALIVPAFDALEGWAAQHGVNYSSRRELVNHPDVVALYRERIDGQSSELAGYESVKAFKLLEREFSEASREITPTQKIRRRMVEQSFAAEIEAVYANAG